jgi:hypothetical protein
LLEGACGFWPEKFCKDEPEAAKFGIFRTFAGATGVKK